MSVLENGERVTAQSPKFNLQKPQTASSTISPWRKGRQDPVPKHIDSDKDSAAVPTEKKTVKCRRVKKKVTILPHLSKGSSGEDFDMQEVNVMRFLDEEPNDELADIAKSPSSYPTPDISADLLPLWKTFTDKLPVECMTWSSTLPSPT